VIVAKEQTFFSPQRNLRTFGAEWFDVQRSGMDQVELSGQAHIFIDRRKVVVV
jgi:hypothetical protein